MAANKKTGQKVKAEVEANLIKYEMMVILKPLLPEDIRNKTIEQINSLVATLGGSIELKESWGKRHLAYDIDGHEEGYYLIYWVTLSSRSTAKFNDDLGLMSDILRFMLVKETEL